MTELRGLGDNKTIVLHTNDNQVYRELLALVKPLKIIPYEQEQEGRTTMVGVDLYFPREYRKWLERYIRTGSP